MAKKRQEDFKKTKLKVGRTLPKGLNITKTSFKSKKIFIHKQIKEENLTSVKQNLDGILKIIGKANASIDSDALHQLSSCILEDKNAALDKLRDILQKVSRYVMHQNSKIRQSALRVLCTVLEIASSEDIGCYFPLLISNLCSAMSHLLFSVKKDSLELFDTLLKYHPNLVYHSLPILQHLINMISKKSINNDGEQKRTLRVIINDNVKSLDWYIVVVSHLDTFLKVVLKNIENSNESNDESTLYCEKQPLSYHLYPCNDLEALCDWDYSSESIHCLCDDPEKFTAFLSELVPLIFEIFNETVSSLASAKDECCLSKGNLQNLNIVLPVLCHVGEWIKLISNSSNQLEVWFVYSFCEHISKIFHNFPFTLATDFQSAEQVSCLELNMSSCFLYSMFLLNAKPEEIHNRVQKYIENVFSMPYKFAYSSIPVLLKITKNYMLHPHIGLNEKVAILEGLCNLVKVSDHRPHSKLLQSFFMDLSTNLDFEDLCETSAMEEWHLLLREQLEDMIESKEINKAFLKTVQRNIFMHRNCFIEAIQKIEFQEYLEFLNTDDEDFQATIALLICHKKGIKYEDMKLLSRIILSPSFSCRSACEIIEHLAIGFSKRSCECNRAAACVCFILHTFFDIDEINKEVGDCCQIPEFLEKWNFVKTISKYGIFPSVGWEKHSTISEACLQSLLLFPRIEYEKFASTFLLKVLGRRELPAHSVTAVFKFVKCFADSNQFKQHELLSSLFYLTFSSLLCTSVWTTVTEDIELGCSELSEFLKFSSLINKNTALRIVEYVKKILPNVYGLNEAGLHYLLRIFLYMASRKLLVVGDREVIFPLFEKLEIVLEKDALPVWSDLCNLFNF